MKITPEQNKTVQSYINYMLNLYNKPQALPPPKTKINKRTKSTSNTQEFFVDSNGVARPANASVQYNNTSLPHPNTRRLAPPSNAVQNATSNNNPIYNSIWSLIKDNPKTSYTALASIFSAPVLYSMFGGSEDTPSGTVPKGTNADTNNYKLLANKAKQDINKEYANARKTNSNITGVSSSTNTQSTTQNVNNDLKQLNELSTRIDTNMAKLKALEAETLSRIQKQQANQKLPQNPQSGNVWDTSSADIGIFDAPDNYTPILPNNPILPHTGIDINNGTNTLAENVTNKPVDQGTTQGTNVPEKKEIPAIDTNTPKNAIGNSIKKVANQNAKKDTSSVNKKESNTDTGTIKPEQSQTLNNQDDWATKQAYMGSAIQDYYNDHGVDKSLIKLNPAQSDYYRYLTGYRRMDPNQAILSMGLDPNKYYYQHDPAYYH